MTVITLSDEQARQIGEANAPIVLVDRSGKALGTFAPTLGDSPGPDATEEEIVADIKLRIAKHDGSFRLFSDLLKDLRQQFPE